MRESGCPEPGLTACPPPFLTLTAPKAELGRRAGGRNPHRSLLPAYTPTVCPQPPNTGVQTEASRAAQRRRSLYLGGGLTHAATKQSRAGSAQERGRSRGSRAEAAAATRRAPAPLGTEMPRPEQCW